MQNKKNEKGITLIILIITVFILLIISIPVIINTSNVIQFNRYTKFKNDMDILRENISVAYFDKDIKTIGPKYEEDLEFLNQEQNGIKIKNDNDNENYYAIDINKVNEQLRINMNKLNYGLENSNIRETSGIYAGTTDDVYIINEASRTIYYVKGIEYNGKKYYRLSEEFSTTREGITPGNFVTDFNKTFTDIYGNTAKIPVGFKVSEKKEEQIISKGLVISDNNGNEFVWIPVQKYKNENGYTIQTEFNRYKYADQVDGGIDSSSNSNKYYNASNNTDFFYESISSFEALSILENKGYYIGRYESGSTTPRTSGSATTTLKINKDLNIYNWVTKEEAQTLSVNFISNNDKVKSRLCSSYAWDTALKFIEQTGNESYLNTAQKSTSLNLSGVESINNIFDLAGNVYEWTSEISSNASNTSTIRGGAFGKTDLAITRTARTNAEADNIGFRITLFLSTN